MLATLLGQIKGVLGKSFLIAGVLPSAVFLFGWKWLRSGGTALAESVRQSFKSPAESAPDAILAGLTLVVMGLIFYAARGPILNFFQALPGPYLAFLYRRGIRRQRRLMMNASREPEELPLTITAFLWSERDFAAYFTRDIPAPFEPSSVAEVLRDSEKARGLLSSRIASARSRDEIVLNEEEEQQLTTGLYQLYLLATPIRPPDPVADTNSTAALPASTSSSPQGSPPPPNLVAEIAAWRELLRRPYASETLRMVKTDLVGRWSRSYQQFQISFPHSEVWLQPTALGNRIAALDDYAEQRYGITTSTLWTRLWGVLSSDSRSEISDARLSMEVMTNFSIGFIVFGILALLASSWETYSTLRSHCRFAIVERFPNIPVTMNCPPDVIFNGRALIGILLAFSLAVVFYHGAIYAFSTLAEKMIRLVDLHRLQLISALGYKTPAKVQEELDILKELNEFFTQPNNPRDPARALVQPPKPQTKSSVAPGSVEDA